MLSIWLLAPFLALAAAWRTRKLELLKGKFNDVPNFMDERFRLEDKVYFCMIPGYSPPCFMMNVRSKLDECQRLKGTEAYKAILAFQVIDRTVVCGLYEGDDCDVRELFPLYDNEDDRLGFWDLGMLDPNLIGDPWGNRTASFKCVDRKRVEKALSIPSLRHKWGPNTAPGSMRPS